MQFLDNKIILVTGGTGSMGKTFVRRVLSGELGTPKKIIIFSRDEGKQHAMRMSYLNRSVATDEIIYDNFKRLIEFRIGDVRDYADVCQAIKNVNIVINAAALKQVPTCEYFPYQAILTNCIGAHNIVKAITEHSYPVEIVCGISTDKACKPVNVMGMTKALQEKIFISANLLNKDTRFICVRYGNVLASRGSVIPLFHDQIIHEGPVTLTSLGMTRFLLSLNDAVDTVFEALQYAQRGETYIPIAKAATISNIAKALIENRNIEIKITGIRPGEKEHEILVSEEECNHCIKRGNYYVILPLLPELRSERPYKNALSKEYNSNEDVLNLSETIDLLKQNNLMLDQSNTKNKIKEESELLC